MSMNQRNVRIGDIVCYFCAIFIANIVQLLFLFSNYDDDWITICMRSFSYPTKYNKYFAFFSLFVSYDGIFNRFLPPKFFVLFYVFICFLLIWVTLRSVMQCLSRLLSSFLRWFALFFSHVQCSYICSG